MSLSDARDYLNDVTDAETAYVKAVQGLLTRYHEVVLGLLATATLTAGLSRMNEGADDLLDDLTVALVAAIGLAQSKAFARFDLGRPPGVMSDRVSELLAPGVARLQQAAQAQIRLRQSLGLKGEAATKGWQRQLLVGGVFPTFAANARRATVGTLNLYTHLAMHQRAASLGDRIWGAYNPLDERTAEVDRALCTNTGDAVTTSSGRTVRSISGLRAKYDADNLWVPGAPRLGGDTHDGCRCTLIPEQA